MQITSVYHWSHSTATIRCVCVCVVRSIIRIEAIINLHEWRFSWYATNGIELVCAMTKWSMITRARQMEIINEENLSIPFSLVFLHFTLPLYVVCLGLVSWRPRRSISFVASFKSVSTDRLAWKYSEECLSFFHSVVRKLAHSGHRTHSKKFIICDEMPYKIWLHTQTALVPPRPYQPTMV